MSVARFSSLIALSTILIGTSLAHAGPLPGVADRQKTQLRLIHQGAKNGSLTIRETHRLLHQEARIQRQKRRIKADGVVTMRERARLHHRLNHQRVRIYRKKHN